MTRKVNLQAANPSIEPGTDTSSQLEKKSYPTRSRKGTLMKMILAKNPVYGFFILKKIRIDC
ncbi:hypothetical protein [Mesobacillus harenae]|uniref:hypothetical protein n=1 Tax=Mesobacillus harenae TaxID=2213203 RepID=UPI001580607F|nr:hypothetical protein [Mesobacillus harenae]